MKRVIREKLRSLSIDILAFVSMFILLQVAVALIFANVNLGLFDESGHLIDYGFLVTYFCATAPMLILATRYESWRYKYSMSIKASLRGLDPTTVLLCFTLLIAANITLSPLMELLPHADSTIPLGGWSLLTVCVIAPIFEELIFRGRLFSMLNHSSSALTSAMLSAVVFGAVHGDITVMIEGFVAGMIFSYAYISKGSIIAPIILHMCNNAIAYALIILSYQDKSMLALLSESADMSVVYITAFIITAIGSFIVIRGIRKSDKYIVVEE